MGPVSVIAIVGSLVLGLASGFIQQRTLDKWTQDTGRAPMIHKGRGSWSRYLRSVDAELPPSIRQRIAFWKWIGILSIVLMTAVFALDAWHRR